MGTIHTRGGPFSESSGGAFFGGYPYQAVAVDVEAVGKLCAFDGEQSNVVSGWFTVWGGIFCFLSLPLDAVIDTVFLPCDLVGWSFGYKRRWDRDFR